MVGAQADDRQSASPGCISMSDFWSRDADFRRGVYGCSALSRVKEAIAIDKGEELRCGLAGLDTSPSLTSRGD